jgi:hypothetical protein
MRCSAYEGCQVACGGAGADEYRRLLGSAESVTKGFAIPDRGGATARRGRMDVLRYITKERKVFLRMVQQVTGRRPRADLCGVAMNAQVDSGAASRLPHPCGAAPGSQSIFAPLDSIRAAGNAAAALCSSAAFLRPAWYPVFMFPGRRRADHSKPAMVRIPAAPAPPAAVFDQALHRAPEIHFPVFSS